MKVASMTDMATSHGLTLGRHSAALVDLFCLAALAVLIRHALRVEYRVLFRRRWPCR